MATISILGCGWLGLPLAEKLIANGHAVKGSTTSTSKIALLAKKNIIPFEIQLPESDINTEFFDADYLIIDVPPQTRSKGPNHHLSCIESILRYIPERLKIIYISSTSVYPDYNSKITEEDELDDSDRAKALWQVEKLLKNRLANRLSIIRMGGLLGYDRIPGRYYAGKEVKDGSKKVNYIHRDDAIGVIQALLYKNEFGELLNAVAPLHPTKREVIIANAKEMGFEPPSFSKDDSTLSSRFISGEKIKQKLDYTFIYPDPRSFYYTK